MKISKNTLLKAVLAVRPGVSNKGALLATRDFIFTGEEVITHNENFCITYPFKTNFQCSIKADEFYELVSLMGDENVSIECTDEGTLKISGSDSDVGLLVTKYESDPYIKALGVKEIKKWKKLPEDFVQGLSLCLFSASKDILSGLSCISVNDNRILSTDNFRISSYEMESSIRTNFLITLPSAIELIKYDVVQFYLTDSWAHFKTEEGITFSSRVMKTDFPDVEQHLEVEGTTIHFPKELNDVLDFAKIVINDLNDITEQKVSVHLKKGLIICKGEGNIGWAERRMPFKYKGKDATFIINPTFLKQIIAKASDVTIGGNRAAFSFDKFRHVMLLFE